MSKYYLADMIYAELLVLLKREGMEATSEHSHRAFGVIGSFIHHHYGYEGIEKAVVALRECYK